MGGILRIANLLGCLVFLLTVATAGGLLLWVTQRPATAQPRRITPTTTALDVSSPEAIIAADVKAQADHDWATFLGLRTNQPGTPENRGDWENYRQHNPADDFMRDIVSAQLVGIKSLPINIAQRLDSLDYLYLYPEVRAYYVAVRYNMLRERLGFRDGVNYIFFVLGIEDGRWVIVQCSSAPIQRVINLGYGFGTPEEQDAARRQQSKRP